VELAWLFSYTAAYTCNNWYKARSLWLFGVHDIHEHLSVWTHNPILRLQRHAYNAVMVFLMPVVHAFITRSHTK
jgi:hypothetical protein